MRFKIPSRSEPEAQLPFGTTTMVLPWALYYRRLFSDIHLKLIATKFLENGKLL